jgi:hypothetical protein
MPEDHGGTAHRFENRRGLHFHGVADLTAVNKRNFAFRDWHWSAFAAEAGDNILLRGELRVQPQYKPTRKS